jgi:hypothetical protein
VGWGDVVLARLHGAWTTSRSSESHAPTLESSLQDLVITCKLQNDSKKSIPKLTLQGAQAWALKVVALHMPSELVRVMKARNNGQLPVSLCVKIWQEMRVDERYASRLRYYWSVVLDTRVLLDNVMKKNRGTEAVQRCLVGPWCKHQEIWTSLSNNKKNSVWVQLGNLPSSLYVEALLSASGNKLSELKAFQDLCEYLVKAAAGQRILVDYVQDLVTLWSGCEEAGVSTQLST